MPRIFFYSSRCIIAQIFSQLGNNHFHTPRSETANAYLERMGHATIWDAGKPMATAVASKVT